MFRENSRRQKNIVSQFLIFNKIISCIIHDDNHPQTSELLAGGWRNVEYLVKLNIMCCRRGWVRLSAFSSKLEKYRINLQYSDGNDYDPSRKIHGHQKRVHLYVIRMPSVKCEHEKAKNEIVKIFSFQYLILLFTKDSFERRHGRRRQESLAQFSRQCLSTFLRIIETWSDFHYYFIIPPSLGSHPKCCRPFHDESSFCSASERNNLCSALLTYFHPMMMPNHCTVQFTFVRLRQDTNRIYFEAKSRNLFFRFICFLFGIASAV